MRSGNATSGHVRQVGRVIDRGTAVKMYLSSLIEINPGLYPQDGEESLI